MSFPADPVNPRPWRALRIGVDARAATEVIAGRGRVVRELLKAFAAIDTHSRFTCYGRSSWDEALPSTFHWHLVNSPDPLWHLRTASAAGRTCDVFLSTNSYLTVPFLRIPSVVVVHDLLALEPGTHPQWQSAFIERLTLGSAVRQAEYVLCPSQATADALTARHPDAAARTIVVPLGVSPSLTASDSVSLPYELPQDFILAVGTLEPRKNLPRLVSAFQRLPAELQRRFPLVVVGTHGWRERETMAALDSLGSRCIRLEGVSDSELGFLYRRCSVFCYPSLGEGFGLPVLEAMAAGAAVVTSNHSALPEVGGDAVAYVQADSVTSIAAGLLEMLTDNQRRNALKHRAACRAQGFTWLQTAISFRDVLDAAAAAAGSRNR